MGGYSYAYAYGFRPRAAAAGGGPALSFGFRPRIAAVGDSRVNIQAAATGTVPDVSLNTYHKSGVIGWAEMLSGRFHGALSAMWASSQVVGGVTRRFSGANLGFSSQTSSWVIANSLPVALALKPDALLLQAGINDGGNSDVPGSPTPTDTATFNNIVAFYDACKANVVSNAIGYTVPIITTVIPTSATQGKAAPNAINKLIRDRFASDPTCIFIDAAAIMMDGALYGFVDEDRMDDALHTSVKGEYILGVGIAAALDARIAPSVTNWLAEAPATNLLPAATGTSGVRGTRVTGSVWTGWNVSQPSGSFFSTCVCSVGSDSIGAFMDLTITPVAGNAFEDFIIRPNTANVTLGTAGASTGKNYVLRAGFNVPNTDKIISISPRLAEVGTATRTAFGTQEVNNATERFPAGYAHLDWRATPALKVSSLATAITPTYRIRFVTAGADGSSFVVRIYRPALEEVNDQATLWA